jgi:hypothetical protein
LLFVEFPVAAGSSFLIYGLYSYIINIFKAKSKYYGFNLPG